MLYTFVYPTCFMFKNNTNMHTCVFNLYLLLLISSLIGTHEYLQLNAVVWVVQVQFWTSHLHFHPCLLSRVLLFSYTSLSTLSCPFILIHVLVYSFMSFHSHTHLCPFILIHVLEYSFMSFYAHTRPCLLIHVLFSNHVLVYSFMSFYSHTLPCLLIYVLLF